MATERYRIYCEAQGRTPDEQRAHDAKRWPGGRMCGYILFIQRAVAQAERTSQRFMIGAHVWHHDDFTEWLRTWSQNPDAIEK